MEKNIIDNLIVNYIENPEDSNTNFILAHNYEKMGHTASAVSFYIRSAERTDDDLLKYECLLRSSMCFQSQGTRNFTVKGLLQHAVSLMPNRPEAYYMLSKFYEKSEYDGHWFDSYTIASIGDKVCDYNAVPLRTNVDYPGNYGIIFQKAVASWWCGLCDESRNIFIDLYENYELDDIHKESVKNNLKTLNYFESDAPFKNYQKSDHDNLKVKFKNSNKIEKNYSESYQDIFVLTMLDGKCNGRYLEIGSADPFYGNNTALLETEFGWEGISIDIDENFVNLYNSKRKNKCLLKDASLINYSKFLSGLEFPQNIDYLQIDCDPPEVSYNILLNIPFEVYKFAVITYEHDYYCDDTKSFQQKSTKFLESYGYVKVVNNISPDDDRPYEDWWVHPDLIDKEILSKMMCINDTTKKAEKYILKIS